RAPLAEDAVPGLAAGGLRPPAAPLAPPPRRWPRRRAPGTFPPSHEPGTRFLEEDEMTPNEKPSNRYLRGNRINPPAITGKESAADLIDQAFMAYNGARLREGARLLVERMLADDVTVALSITGALTPAGLGMSALIPLIQAGFVDWIVSTGA